MNSKIPPRQRCCAKCGERFGPGERLTSVLSLSLSEEYVRADFCDRCWQATALDEGMQGVWKSQYPIPPEEGDENAAEDQRILALLLDSMDEPLRAYILALYLVRRGMLYRVRHPQGGRSRMLLYEVKSTGECLEIPHVSAAEAAQADLTSIL